MTRTIYIATTQTENENLDCTATNQKDLLSILESTSIKTEGEAHCQVYVAELSAQREVASTMLLIVADTIKNVVEFVKRNIR